MRPPGRELTSGRDSSGGDPEQFELQRDDFQRAHHVAINFLVLQERLVESGIHAAFLGAD